MTLSQSQEVRHTLLEALKRMLAAAINYRIACIEDRVKDNSVARDAAARDLAFAQARAEAAIHAAEEAGGRNV